MPSTPDGFRIACCPASGERRAARRGAAAASVLFVVLALTGACSGSGGTTAPAPAPTQPGPPPPPLVPPGVSPLVASMYQQLPAYIASTLSDLQALLPNNPHNAPQINAKISLLQRSTLAAEISEGRLFVEGSVSSSDGRGLGVAALFPEERLRSEAVDAVRLLERALPVLETFIATPFPTPAIRLWYGFKVGNSGGGGTLHMEDRGSYESRTPASRLPYDAILGHELAHSYIGNEILTQFLEMYVYNRLRGSGAALSSWTHTRGYNGISDANVDSALTLDVYQLIGRDAMSRAYKAAYPLGPPYGQPLSTVVIQVFVDQASDQERSLVATKLARITF